MVSAIWVGAVAVIITDGAEAEDTGTITIKTLSSVALKGPPAKAAPFGGGLSCWQVVSLNHHPAHVGRSLRHHTHV
jgi:hypothetical protein